MQFLRSDVLRVVIDAYIFSRKERWESYYKEPVVRVYKFLRWQAYEGEQVRRADCDNLEKSFLKPLETNPADIDKWIDLCCYLNNYLAAKTTYITVYFKFIRDLLLLHVANHAVFKVRLKKSIEKLTLSDSAESKTTLALMEQLLQQLGAMDGVKLSAELKSTFESSITTYDTAKKFKTYEEFLAAVMLNVPDKTKEVKEAPVKPLSTTTTVQKKLYSAVLVEGMLRKVEALHHKLAQPVSTDVSPALEIKVTPAVSTPVVSKPVESKPVESKQESPWDIDLTHKTKKAKPVVRVQPKVDTSSLRVFVPTDDFQVQKVRHRRPLKKTDEHVTSFRPR